MIVLRLVYTFFGPTELDSIWQEQSYLLSLASIELSRTAHIWISGIFVGFNILLINHIIRINQAYDENNYLAGFIFLIFAHSSSQLFLLSGGLIASSCLLVAIHLMLSHVKQRASEENIFFTGALLGFSVLFYSPLMIFLPLTLLIYVFFTRTIPRRYLLSTFGFVFPFLIVFSISLFGAQKLDLAFFFGQQFNVGLMQLEEINYLFLIVPVILTLSKLFTSFSGISMTNHQIHIQRVMFVIFLATIYVFFADSSGSGFLWIFSITATYFVSKTLLEINKKWVRRTVFLLWSALLMNPYLLAADL